MKLACGASNPNAEVEAHFQALRKTQGFKTDSGCGREIDFENPVHIAMVYRCVECARWMHKVCILAHFAESRHDQRIGAPA